MPVHARDQPVPLCLGQSAHALGGLRPVKVAAMQPPGAEPDAAAIPDQHFEAVAAPVAKGVGATVAGGFAQGFLRPSRQAIDPQPHVDRFDRQAHLMSMATQTRVLTAEC